MSAAVSEAIARTRRDGLPLAKVEAPRLDGPVLLCNYDALRLAKDLVRNRVEGVVLTTEGGNVLDSAAILAARY